MQGEQTRLYFSERNDHLPNLNPMKQDKAMAISHIESMKSVVSDFGFEVRLKTASKPEPGAENGREVEAKCGPLKITVLPHSASSFVDTVKGFSGGSAGEEKTVSRLLEKADFVSKEAVEYDVGYEMWESAQVAVLGAEMYLLSVLRPRVLAKFDVHRVLDCSIGEAKDGAKELVVNFEHSKAAVRTRNLDTLTEIKFKLTSLREVMREEENEENEEEEVFRERSMQVKVEFEAMELVVVGESFHERGRDFRIQLDRINWESHGQGNSEVGKLSLSGGTIFDDADGVAFLEVKEREEKGGSGLNYSFNYDYGNLQSLVEVESLKVVYKVEYIESFLFLTDFLVIAATTEDSSAGKIGSVPHETNPLEDQVPVRYTSLKRRTRIEVKKTLVEVFYKSHIKCVDVVAGIVGFDVVNEGTLRRISGRFVEFGVFEVNSYPFSFEGKTLGERFALVRLEEEGSFDFDIVLDNGISKGSYKARRLEVNWVQQRCMRFIDFMMYQVLELFYPSLLSLSKHFNRSTIIRSSVATINSSEYMKHEIELSDITINMPSTTNEKIGVTIRSPLCTLSNRRLRTRRLISVSSHFPYPDLESELFFISVENVVVSLFSGSVVSKSFGIKVVVDIPKKLFELGFLYDLIIDECKMQGTFRDEMIRMETAGSGGKKRTGKVLEGIEKQEAINWANTILKETPEDKSGRFGTMYLDGRYHISISTEEIEVDMSNEAINAIYDVTSTNINFDDRMDSVLRNTYVANSDGVMLLLTMDLGKVVAVVHDYIEKSLELLRMSCNGLEFCMNKRSDYVSHMEFSSVDFVAKLSESLNVPKRYNEIINQKKVKKTEVNLLDDIEEEVTKSLTGTIKLTPDYKKDITLELEDCRIVVFSFLMRLLPQLLSLKPVKQHKGYEELDQGLILMNIKVKKAEMCLVSNQEFCLVLDSRFFLTRFSGLPHKLHGGRHIEPSDIVKRH